jgi:hypothetical protein
MRFRTLFIRIPYYSSECVEKLFGNSQQVSKWGFRRRPRGVEGAPIDRFLPPKKPGPETFGYFLNSIGREILRSSDARRSNTVPIQ